MAKVSISKCDIANAGSCLNNLLSNLPPLQISEGHTVGIKPNLCTDTKGEKGATTDVRLIDALISYLNSNWKNLRILVVESQSWGGLSTSQTYEACGYTKLTEKYDNVELIDLTRLEDKKFYSHEKFTFLNDEYSLTKLPELFSEIDFFISFAKLKTHVSCKVTGVLKNLFGCLPLSYKFYYHPHLEDVVSDLNLLLEPQLCLIDGIYSLEGLGPNHGKVKKTNLLIAGNDPVATDAVMSQIIGYENPLSIPIIKECSEKGCGTLDYEVIDEEKVLEKDYDFIKPSKLGVLVNQFYFWLQGKIRLLQRLGYKLTLMKQEKK